MKPPFYYNNDSNEITNINASSASFDFLMDQEEDIYTILDLEK